MEVVYSRIIIYSCLIFVSGILCDRKLEKRQAESSCSENNDDHFFCTNGPCIEWSLVCDGHKDCSDGSDETKELCARYEYGTNNNTDCGKEVDNKTVDGSPWLVYIHRIEPNRIILGIGSIIAPNIVVAMADSFWRYGLNYKQNMINDGDRYLYEIEILRQTKINNPYYIKIKMIYFVEDISQYGSNGNDLAVIVLADNISFRNGVLPVCIDWYNKYSVPNTGQVQIFSTQRSEDQRFMTHRLNLNGYYLLIDNSSCLHLYDTYSFADSVTYDKSCIRIIREKTKGETFIYQSLSILYSDSYFLTGLKSFWSTLNNKSALGFIHIKYYVPWIRGILNKHALKYDSLKGSVKSCVLPNAEGVVYSYESSGTILTPGTLINHHQTVIENCEVQYHKAFTNGSRFCQENGKWITNYEKLCLKMCPPLISDSLDIKCILNGKYTNCLNPSIPLTTATTSCKSTYSAPNGQGTPLDLLCQSNGKWNKQLYTCNPINLQSTVNSCVLPTFEGVVYSYEDSNESLPHGTLIDHYVTVIENCELGYHKAYPNSFRVCQRNGKWKTVSDKLCLKMCPPLISDSLDIKCTLNGKYANCSNPSIPDTIASLSCKPTYSAPKGRDTPLELFCQSNGKWNSQLYTCKPANLCILPTVEGVVYTYEDSNESLPHGTLIDHYIIVIENCEVGYHKAYTNGFRICQRNGKWKTVSDKLCLKMCPPLISDSLDIKCTLNGKYANCSNPSIPDTTASPTCKSTHTLPNGQEETPLDIHCQSNGIWDNKLYRCEPFCGKVYIKNQALINNGKTALVGTAPWNVGIYKFNKFNYKYDLICGGSIISSNLVVSAAHCFWEKDMISNTIAVNDGQYIIAVGKYARDLTIIDNQFTKIMNVEIVYLKEGFYGITGHLAEDIAVIVLKNKISFSTGVAPVCIDWRDIHNVVDGDRGKIVGWGTTEEGIPSPILLEASLPYLNNGFCRNMFKNGFESYVTVDKFCAGSVSVSGQRVDKGDSGAGLCFLHSQLYYLTGVVSSKDPETNSSIAIFTDVKFHIQWIRKLFVTHN